MANEKNWHYRQNIDIDGADDTETGQNWMFEFYTFLSGGADDTSHTGAWEIVSASNGSSVVNAWTGSGDVVFDDDPASHSWFVARSNTILPVTGAGGDRYLYLTVDCQNSGPTLALFRFDYNTPQFPGLTTAAPAQNAAITAYERNDLSYRYEFDAGVGRTSYFHGIMNETGSFQIFSARSNDGYSNYPFTLGIHRLETPRSPNIDPYPVMMFTKFRDGAAVHGCWDASSVMDWAHSNTNNGNPPSWDCNSASPGYGGLAMWKNDGTNESTGWGTSMMPPAVTAYPNATVTIGWSSANTINVGNGSFDLNGDDIDGSWPLLPFFVANGFVASSLGFKSIRGRVADLRMGCSAYGTAYDPSGFTIPVTGTITGCQIGSVMFPATASWLPGV